jgi:RimJ/RimL family protein N-acetyltransferase
MPEVMLRTDRLLLRQWRDTDLGPMAAINADPDVMEFIGSPMSEAETAAFLERIRAEWVERDYGLFAVELLEGERGVPVGFIGLHRPGFDPPEVNRVEIGWRLAPPAWGRGLATEGASAVREWAHGPRALEEIISFTAAINERSRRVMDKIGLVRDKDADFDHPNVAPDSPLRRHVLYRGRAGDAPRDSV